MYQYTLRIPRYQVHASYTRAPPGVLGYVPGYPQDYSGMYPGTPGNTRGCTRVPSGVLGYPKQYSGMYMGTPGILEDVPVYARSIYIYLVNTCLALKEARSRCNT